MKEVIVSVRLTKEQRDAVEKLAQAKQRSVSDWARMMFEREIAAAERRAAAKAEQQEPA